MNANDEREGENASTTAQSEDDEDDEVDVSTGMKSAAATAAAATNNRRSDMRKRVHFLLRLLRHWKGLLLRVGGRIGIVIVIVINSNTNSNNTDNTPTTSDDVLQRKGSFKLFPGGSFSLPSLLSAQS
jgi:hypothetical protein